MDLREHEALVHTFIDDQEFMLCVIWEGQVWQWALSAPEIANLIATCETWQREGA